MSDGDSLGAGGEVKAAVGALFDAMADVYDTVIDYFGRFGRRLVDAAQLQPGADVLDLACGRGAVLWPALTAVGERGSVLGIDVAPAMVSRLRAELAQRALENVEVRIGDAEHLDLPDASFDAVTGGFMIFFPPEPMRVLGEIRRVLRPGGRVALSIYDGPAGFSFQSELEASVGAAPRAASGGRRFNEAAVLRAATAEVGFRVVETVEMGSGSTSRRWSTPSAGSTRPASVACSRGSTIDSSRRTGRAWPHDWNRSGPRAAATGSISERLASSASSRIERPRRCSPTLAGAAHLSGGARNGYTGGFETVG